MVGVKGNNGYRPRTHFHGRQGGQRQLFPQKSDTHSVYIDILCDAGGGYGHIYPRRCSCVKMLVRLDSVERFQLVDTVANILSIVKIAFAPTVLFGVMIVAYWALPVERVRIKTAVPGAAFTTILWMLLSFGVSSYINIVGINTYMYGSLASVILLALWLYMCMYVMLIGAEINKFMDNGIRGIRRRAHKAGRKKRRLERKKKRVEKRRMRKNRHLKMDEEVDVEVDK